MNINNRKNLEEWLDQNHWFEDGFISEINELNNGLEIVVGYQTSGTYVAGEKREIKEFSIKPIGLKNWSYKKEQFTPSKDISINGIDLPANGIGLKFSTPSQFELICESLEISEAKITQTYTKPWVSNREFFITAISKEVPTPRFWVEQFEKHSLEIGFRYYSSELIQTEKVPYPDYSGYYIQTIKEISKTDRGLLIKFVNFKNGELIMGIENQEENEELFKTFQLIVSNWDNSIINSGNVEFAGAEFKEFLEKEKYPDRIEKIKNLW